MESGVFGVLDVALTLGFAFQGVASKLCFRDKSQLKWRYGWKSFQTCGVVHILLKLAELCPGFEVWKRDFRGRRRES